MAATTDDHRSTAADNEVFNDPIHGHIKLDKELLTIIDTPEFQRLRGIKLLGATYFVYPGASYNCFEHAIGTAHLAGEVLRMLFYQQPDLKIERRDILNVQKAALCRELGRGPYSHIYHDTFLPLVKNNTSIADTTLMMFDSIKSKIVDPGDREFVAGLLRGPQPGGRYVNPNSSDKKRFLYEIICSPVTGFGVAMWDKLARSGHHTHIKTPFECARFIDFMQITEHSAAEDGNGAITFRDKVHQNVYNAYCSEHVIQSTALKHKTVVALEQMLAEILQHAEKSGMRIKLRGNDNPLKLSECVTNADAFMKLTDSIFDKINDSVDDDEHVKEAQRLLHRLHTRDIYHFIGRAKLKPDAEKSLFQLDQLETSFGELNKQIGRRERLESVYDVLEKEAVELNKIGEHVDRVKRLREHQITEEMKSDLEDPKDNIFVKIIIIEHCKDGRDPVSRMLFFSKHKPFLPRPLARPQVSQILPCTFRDVTLMVFVRESDKSAKTIFRQWCKKNEAAWAMCSEAEDDLEQPT